MTSHTPSIQPQVHRKPVPVPNPTFPPAHTTTATPSYPPYNNGVDAVSPQQAVQSAPQLPPVEKMHPLEPPTKTPESHARKGSIPNMLKKIQKVATMPIPHIDHPSPPVPQKDPPLPPIPSVTQTGASPPTLKKTRGGARSSSAELLPANAKLQPNRLQSRRLSPSPSPESRVRSSSAQPPSTRNNAVDGARASSNPGLAPPSEAGDNGSGQESRGRLRRSWLPGGRSRSGSQDLGKGSGVWVMSPGGTAEYNPAILTSGEKVPELWNESGLVYVYLHPKGSGRGPSFKVSDQIFSDSRLLTELLLHETIARSQESPSAQSQPLGSEGLGEGHLYLPLGGADLEHLVVARNLIAFLTGQPLVGTKTHPTVFSAFLHVSGLLRQFEFSNYDGSNFGDSVEARFESCIDQFNLADVRHSREKTLEALVLGEQMKSWTLYNEGFAHAVGKYDEILDLKSPLYKNITASTRNRLERAHLDLVSRQTNANSRIESFEFPSLFAGIASSTSTEAYKNVRFKEWKTSFLKMRSFVLAYYKDLFGNWPPKARSKRNNFSHSGLNRICLKMLYSDLCALYDLLVDRDSLTPRGIDQGPEDINEDHLDPMISALRKMLGEFDTSSPPVLPPIPYDVPKLPTMTAIREDYNNLSAKKQAKFDKGLAANELLLIFIKSHNIDTDSLKMPFLTAFKEFELKEAKGVLPHDMADQRIGYWLFLYVVLQSLPMLVVDAPGLHFTDGVEYFLCEPPQGNLPWMDDAGEVRKMWYQTAGQGIVELSADVVMFSVEATYMRSHCWLAAKEWEAAKASGSVGTPTSAQQAGSGAMVPPALEPLEPPRNVFQDMDPYSSPVPGSAGSIGQGSPQGSPQLLPIRGRNSSPAGRASAMANHFHRSSVAMGLEPLAMPDGGMPGERRVVSSRPSSSAGLQRQHLGQRSQSIGNLAQLAAMDSGELPPPVPPGKMHKRTDSAGGGSTFDDILKGMDQEKTKSKKRFGF